MPHAVLAGDLDTVAELADALTGLRVGAFARAPAAIAIARSLAFVQDGVRLRALAPGTRAYWWRGSRRRPDGCARPARAPRGNPVSAGELLTSAETNLRTLGRDYDAACVAFEVACALDAGVDELEAREARQRARRCSSCSAA